MLRGRHKTIGFIGMAGLLLVYFGIVAFSESLDHAFEQFYDMWYYILILSVGFGIHVGLYSHIRSTTHKSKGLTAEVAASGGVSTVSMAACCAHHVVDVLPLIGLSAAVIYFTQYQIPLIMLGIFSNLLGITILLTLIQKHKLYDIDGVLSPLFRLNMKAVRNAAIVVSVIVVSSSFVYTFTDITKTASANDNRPVELELPSITKKSGGVAITVKPLKFSFDRPVKFKVTIDTHSGALNFDMTKVSILEDRQGGRYEPVLWEGSAVGGHHRKGTLIFPKLKDKTESIKLVIQEVSGVSERVFEWSLAGSKTVT